MLTSFRRLHGQESFEIATYSRKTLCFPPLRFNSRNPSFLSETRFPGLDRWVFLALGSKRPGDATQITSKMNFF